MSEMKRPNSSEGEDVEPDLKTKRITGRPAYIAMASDIVRGARTFKFFPTGIVYRPGGGGNGEPLGQDWARVGADFKAVMAREAQNQVALEHRRRAAGLARENPRVLERSRGPDLGHGE